MFIMVVKTSDDSKSGAFILETLVKAIKEIDPQNVVQVIMDKISSCE